MDGSVTIAPKHFEKIRNIVYDGSGIQLNEGKESLVIARLSKRMRTLGLESFEAYLKVVEEDKSGKEKALLLDTLTTNKTSFFREPQHFDYLKTNVLPQWDGRSARRIWSAACSTGEEPYSIAMLLQEEGIGPGGPVKILATDISARVLAKAREGVYEEATVVDIPPLYLSKYFERDGSQYCVSSDLQTMIRFAHLNLQDSWPMKNKMDVIFLRNVMIYFDKKTQEELVRRMTDLLNVGGYLFVGHSESLTCIQHDLMYVQPAVYQRYR